MDPLELFAVENLKAHPVLALAVILLALFLSVFVAIRKAMGPIAPAMRDLVIHLRSYSRRLSTIEERCINNHGPDGISSEPLPEIHTDPAFKVRHA